METPDASLKAGARLLALDVGARRIGVAISGRVGDIVEPLFAMTRKGDRQDAKSVGRLVRKHAAAAVVVGHPLRLGGEKSAQTLRVERFAEELRGFAGVPVLLHDERLSSAAAQEQMTQHGRALEDRGLVDQIAAVVILEGFLLHRAHLSAIARVRDQSGSAPGGPEQP